MKPKYKKITINDIDYLKKESKEEGIDVFIQLNYGVRSSKHIQWLEKEKKFYILNEVDNSEQELTEKELFDDSITNIGKAIKLGALWQILS